MDDKFKLQLHGSGLEATRDAAERYRPIIKAHSVEITRLHALNADLLAALKAAVKIADEARDEWDRAPDAMRAGKLLIALSGRLKGYRHDIDIIHVAIARAQPPETNQGKGAK